jgi:cation/acetate symporter
VSDNAITTLLFLVVVGMTIGITIWAGRQTSGATDYYSGGRQFSGLQNGLAVSGDYMSAASFLGISGLISLYGYDGFLYSIGFLVAWLVALMLAELLRNSGRFTMADQLAYRMRPRPVRTAAAISTVVVSIFYLLAQMVGAGTLVALLLGFDTGMVKDLTIAGVGLLMIFYVTLGGMKGTSWVQIVKAMLLMSGTVLITFLVLVRSTSTSPTFSAPPRRTPARVKTSCSPGCCTALTWSPSWTSSASPWRWFLAQRDCRTS